VEQRHLHVREQGPSAGPFGEQPEELAMVIGRAEHLVVRVRRRGVRGDDRSQHGA
jgi:hypothetical protein